MTKGEGRLQRLRKGTSLSSNGIHTCESTKSNKKLNCKKRKAGDTHTHHSHPFIYSPKAWKSWTRPQTRAWILMQLSYVNGRDPTAWAITCCLPRHAFTRVWILEFSVTASRHSDMGWRHPKWCLIPWCLSLK